MEARQCKRCRQDRDPLDFMHRGRDHMGVCISCVQDDLCVEQTKDCARCRETKLAKDFSKQRDGLAAWCKTCMALYRRARRNHPPTHTPTTDKKCRACGETKPNDQFYTRRGSPDGLHAQCRECMLESGRKARSRVVLTTTWGPITSGVFRRWMSRYSLSAHELTTLLSQQDCNICGQPFSPQRPGYIDHDHQTGLVRGVLCLHCNLILGHAKDAEDVLRGAANYLDQNGSSNVNQKITAEQAQDIINRVAAGEPQKNLAAEYQVTPGAVSNIVSGKSWPTLHRPDRPSVSQRGCKLKASDIPLIRQRLENREKPGVIAEDYGVTRQAIVDIGKGKTWSHVPRQAPSEKPRRLRVWEQG